MTKIKLCVLKRACDIEYANELMPEYIGFVFANRSSRCVSAKTAGELKKLLNPNIAAVGVFADEAPEAVAELLNSGTIDMAQLHGNEDESYIKKLRELAGGKIIKAFRIKSEEDVFSARNSSADIVLLDSEGGTGAVFDWSLIRDFKRPFFLAGGLNAGNVKMAVETLKPYAVDVSSGIETGGFKDRDKMREFVCAARGAQGKEDIQ